MITFFIIAQNARRAIQSVYSQLAYCCVNRQHMISTRLRHLNTWIGVEEVDTKDGSLYETRVYQYRQHQHVGLGQARVTVRCLTIHYMLHRVGRI